MSIHGDAWTVGADRMAPRRWSGEVVAMPSGRLHAVDGAGLVFGRALCLAPVTLLDPRDCPPRHRRGPAGSRRRAGPHGRAAPRSPPRRPRADIAEHADRLPLPGVRLPAPRPGTPAGTRAAMRRLEGQNQQAARADPD